MYQPLSDPVEAWHFDFVDPPTSSEKKHLDLTFTAEGRFNAVLFWYTLHLGGGVELSTGPTAVASGGASQPACYPSAAACSPAPDIVAGQVSTRQWAEAKIHSNMTLCTMQSDAALVATADGKLLCLQWVWHVFN